MVEDIEVLGSLTFCGSLEGKKVKVSCAARAITGSVSDVGDDIKSVLASSIGCNLASTLAGGLEALYLVETRFLLLLQSQ